MKSAALVFVLFVSCGSSDVCGRLASGSGCTGEAATKCTEALAAAKTKDPTCAPMITALADCIAPLQLSCTSSTGIAAVGTGNIGGGQNFTTIGSYDVVVNDAKCDLYRRGLEACRTCPDAVGAKTPDALGIGDKCVGVSTPCATGLTCQGICTRACSTSDDCKARADDCKLQYQTPNMCASGKCTRGCGSDYTCIADVAANSTCASSACTLP